MDLAWVIWRLVGSISWRYGHDYDYHSSIIFNGFMSSATSDFQLYKPRPIRLDLRLQFCFDIGLASPRYYSLKAT